MGISGLIRVMVSLLDLFVVLVVCLTILPGCSRKTTPAGKASPDNPVRVAYQDRIADAVSIVAIAKEYFHEEGLTDLLTYPLYSCLSSLGENITNYFGFYVRAHIRGL